MHMNATAKKLLDLEFLALAIDLLFFVNGPVEERLHQSTRAFLMPDLRL